MDDPNLIALSRLRELQKTSRANKRKVAALIYNIDEGKFVSEGVNYNPCNNGVCENSDGETYDTVIHAEESAILSLFATGYSRGKEHLILYCTFSPCINCCRLIAQAGICMVYYLDEHKENFILREVKGSYSPLQYLLSQNIKVFKYNESEKSFKDRDFKYIIHHSADIDGLMSGYLLKKEYPEAILIPYNYERDAEWMDDDYVSEFIFADITPPLEWFESMADLIQNDEVKITIYDHHLDRLENIVEVQKVLDLKNKVKIFCNEKTDRISAVGVIKQHCIGVQNFLSKYVGYDMEELLDIISDFDSWGFTQYEKTLRLRINNIVTFLQLSIRNMEELNYFVADFLNKKVTLDDLEKFGSTLNLVTKQNIIKQFDSAKSLCINRQLFIMYEGFPNYLMQELIPEYYNLNEIDSVLYVGYSINLKKQTLKLSARSRVLSEGTKYYITAQSFVSDFGGGGHLDAAGATVPLDNGLSIIAKFPNIK